MTNLLSVRRGVGDLLRLGPAVPGDTVNNLAPVVNPLLTWLHLTDSYGTAVDRYQLLIGGNFASLLRHPLSQMWQAIVETMYGLGSTIMVYMIALVDAISNPTKLVSWLETLYEKILSRIYAVVPPELLIGLTFTILLISVFMLEPRMDKAGKQNGSGLYKSRQGNWERLFAGFFIASFALALSKNPFKPLRSVMQAVSETAGYATGSDAQTIQQSAMSTAVDTILRPITQLITYHDTLSDTCSAQWSKRLSTGTGTLDCLTAVQKSAAAVPGVYTGILALLLLVLAVAYAYLAWNVVRYSVEHAAWIATYVIGLAYLSAIAILQRRPYDPLIKCLSRSAAHAAMLMILISLSLILPAWALDVAHDMTWAPLWMQFLLIAAGIFGSGHAIRYVAEKETYSKLASLFTTKLKDNKMIVNSWMYPAYIQNDKWLLTAEIGDRLDMGYNKSVSAYDALVKALKDAMKGKSGKAGEVSTAASSEATAAASASVGVTVQADPDTDALTAALTQPSLDSGASPTVQIPAEIFHGIRAAVTAGVRDAGSGALAEKWFEEGETVSVFSQWIRPAATPESPTSAITAGDGEGNQVVVVPPEDPIVDAQGNRVFIGREDGIPYILGSNNGVPFVVKIDEDQFSTLRSLAAQRELSGVTTTAEFDRSGQPNVSGGGFAAVTRRATDLPPMLELTAGDTAAIHDPSLESGGTVIRSGGGNVSVPGTSGSSWVRPNYQEFTQAALPMASSSDVIDVHEVFFVPENSIDVSMSSSEHDRARRKWEAEHGGSCVEHDPAEAIGTIYSTIDESGSLTIAVPGQGGVGDSTWT